MGFVDIYRLVGITFMNMYNTLVCDAESGASISVPPGRMAWDEGGGKDSLPRCTRLVVALGVNECPRA